MRRSILVAIAVCGSIGACMAQTDDAATQKEKTMDHYIGVQVNGLIRQVFNFNNTTSNTVTNPYLITYSMNSKKSGWGLRLGAGYNFNSFSTSDGITSVDNKINDLQVRLGVEKLYKLSSKWSAGVGLDLVFNNNDDHTSNTVSPGVGGGTTDMETQITSYGGGPAAWLRYNITDRILIGTEASFYYVTGDETRTISVADPFGGGPLPSTPGSSNTINQGTFNSPVAFFIHVKF